LFLDKKNFFAAFILSYFCMGLLAKKKKKEQNDFFLTKQNNQTYGINNFWIKKRKIRAFITNHLVSGPFSVFSYYKSK